MRGKFFILCLLVILPVSSILAQWTKINSPEIIIPLSTYAVASKGDTLFVGTYRGTIYRSFDNGATWTRSDSGISYLYWTYDFLITQNTIFAMGEEGIFRSTDWGNSWELKNNGLHTGNLINVYAMVKQNNLLFAATDYGVYSSSDNGDIWISTSGDSSSYYPIYSLTELNGVLFEGTESDGVYYSNDNGSTWHSVITGLPVGLNNNILRVNKLFVDGENLYAGINGSGIYHSTNNGNLWLPDTAGLPKKNNGYFAGVYSLAKIGNYFYAGTQDFGLYRKNNSEDSWSAINSGLPAKSFVTSITGNNDKIFAATFDGMYSASLININWSPIFTEYPGTVITKLIASGGNNLFLQATSNYYNGEINRGYNSSDEGGNWLQDSALSNNYTFLIHSYGDSIYAVGNHLLFLSDQGSHWKQIDSGLTRINTLIKNNDTLYTGSGTYYWQWGQFGGAYLSANNGKTWNKIFTADTAIYAVSKIRNNLFLGSLLGVFRSTDLGKNWMSANNGLPPYTYIVCFANIGNNFFAGTSNGIYLSTDYGDSWKEVDSGFPPNAFNNSIINLLVYKNLIFAGTKNGVFLSKDLGSNWATVNDGLSGNALYINSLTINGNDLYIATYNGLWKRALPEIVSVENIKNSLPKDFLLYQNYPNPFNPSTTIRYSLPKESKVTIKIYNIIGQEVVTLVNENQNTGVHKIVWSAKPELTSGVYFCRLTAGSYVDTKKLILLK